MTRKPVDEVAKARALRDLDNLVTAHPELVIPDDPKRAALEACAGALTHALDALDDVRDEAAAGEGAFDPEQLEQLALRAESVAGAARDLRFVLLEEEHPMNNTTPTLDQIVELAQADDDMHDVTLRLSEDVFGHLEKIRCRLEDSRVLPHLRGDGALAPGTRSDIMRYMLAWSALEDVDLNTSGGGKIITNLRIPRGLTLKLERRIMAFRQLDGVRANAGLSSVVRASLVGMIVRFDDTLEYMPLVGHQIVQGAPR